MTAEERRKVISDALRGARQDAPEPVREAPVAPVAAPVGQSFDQETLNKLIGAYQKQMAVQPYSYGTTTGNIWVSSGTPLYYQQLYTNYMGTSSTPITNYLSSLKIS